MTKRWRWGTGGALILLGVMVAAVPAFNGWQAERHWRDQLAWLDAWLTAADEGTGAAVIDYERGVFTARTVSRITLPASALADGLRMALALPPGPIELELVQAVRHGWRGVSFDGHLRPTGPLAATFARLGGTGESVQIRGRIGLGRQSLTVQTETLAGPLDPDGMLRLRLDPLRFESDYMADDRRLTASLDGSGFALRTAGGEALLRLDGVQGDTEGRLEAGLIDAAAELDWTRLAVAGLPVLDGGLALDFARLSPVGLVALAGQDRAGALPLLAETGPRATLTRLRLDDGSGAGLAARADLQVQPRMADRLRAGAGGMAMWSALRLNAAMDIDDALVQTLPEEQSAWLRQLQAFGILRRQDDHWRIEVSMDEGRLSVHGQPWWSGG